MEIINTEQWAPKSGHSGTFKIWIKERHKVMSKLLVAGSSSNALKIFLGMLWSEGSDFSPTGRHVLMTSLASGLSQSRT